MVSMPMSSDTRCVAWTTMIMPATAKRTKAGSSSRGKPCSRVKGSSTIKVMPPASATIMSKTNAMRSATHMSESTGWARPACGKASAQRSTTAARAATDSQLTTGRKRAATKTPANSARQPAPAVTTSGASACAREMSPVIPSLRAGRARWAACPPGGPRRLGQSCAPAPRACRALPPGGHDSSRGAHRPRPRCGSESAPA